MNHLPLPAYILPLVATATLAVSLSAQADGEKPKPAAAKPQSLEVARELAAGKFAGYTYVGKKPAPKTIDEATFVVATIEALATKNGVKLAADAKDKLQKAVSLDGHKKKDVQAALVAAAKLKKKKVIGFGDLPAWASGVQHALVEAGLGEAIDASKAEPGDFVHWWFQYKSGNWGYHVGIVESIQKGRAVIYGAHKSSLASERKAASADRKGGIGSGPLLQLSAKDKKLFVVRFKAAAKKGD